MLRIEPVRWRPNILRSWRAAWPASAIACVAGAVLLIFPAGNALRRWSYDLLSVARPTVVPSEVALVYVDDLSHTRLAQPYDAPWDRRLDAKLVRRLNQIGVRAIGFDILFDRPAGDPAADADFAAAIRTGSNVVLAATLAKGDYFGLASEIQLALPHTNLLAACAGWGFAELPVDPDDLVRTHYAGTEEIPSLSWRMAALLNAPVTGDPRAQRRERWMNYPGGADGLPGVSYYRVLEDSDAALAPFFRDKIVIVGAGSKSGYTGKRKDQFRNPQTWLTGRFSPGAEVHATTLLNLLRGDSLRRPAWWLELGGVGAAGLLLPMLLVLRRPGRAFALATLAVAGTLAIAWVSIVAVNVWSAWLVVALVQIPIATAWAFARPQAEVSMATDGAATQEFRSGGTTEFGSLPAIADHDLLRPIGRGAYGEVWLARGVTGATRAIKIVHRRGFGTDRAFEREFAGVVNFEPVSRQHEGLVQVLHVGRDDSAGFFYYVMELADDAGEGESGHRKEETVALTPDSCLLSTDSYTPRTLRAELDRRQRLPARECLGLARELAAALGFLHERGLVHRDVKPANLIFVGGHLKLADIGLVAETGEARTLVGTEGYLSPEGPGTPQADVFSAGRVLYELLTGLEPRSFPDSPRPIPEVADPALWQALYQVTLQACATEPASRFTDAAELARTLARVEASFPG